MSKHKHLFGLLLAGAMLLVLAPVGTLLAQDRNDAHVDARTFGARGDGKQDDTAQIEAAAQACGTNNGILSLPRTRGAYRISRTLELPAACDLHLDGTLLATAPMEAVVDVGGSEIATRHRIYGTGVIDSGNMARRHIALRNYAHFEVTGVTLLNSASIAGIDIGPKGSKGGYEASIHDVDLFVPKGITKQSGSAGIWSDTGTDSTVHNITIVGWDIGVRNSVHNNQPFQDIHVWGFGPHQAWNNVSNLPSVCFDDEAGDAQWWGVECDTPTAIGLHAHGYNDQIVGFSCFNNDTWGSDNVVNCIQFDKPKPYSSVALSLFQGKAKHRLASDIAIPNDDLSQLVLIGNQAIGFVVKTRSLLVHLPSVAVDGNLYLHGNAMSNTAAQAAPAQGGTCLDGSNRFPCTVAKLTPTNLKSANSAAEGNLFTTSQPGVYQITVRVHSLGNGEGSAIPVACLGTVIKRGPAASLRSSSDEGISSASMTLDAAQGVPIGYRIELKDAHERSDASVSAEVVRLQ